MPITVIGPSSVVNPRTISCPIIEIKESWSDTWLSEPELEMVRAHAAAGGHDLGSCELQRRYGSIKQPYESSFSTKSSWNLDKWWVRLSFITRQGVPVVWVGQISGEARNIYGSDVAKTGVQQWVAYSPLQTLRKKPVSTSFWLESAAEKEVGWIPPMNSRDRYNRLVGNRTASESNGTYLYGGTSTWTHKDAVDYILTRFADESGVSGPEWTLGGQDDLLDDIQETIQFGATQSVAQVLRRLIPPRLGIDFKIVPYSAGFEVFVFALVATDAGFGGVSLPRNPNTVKVKSSKRHNMPVVKIARSLDHVYGKIRVLGRRIVACCTLRADDATLEGKWDGTLETDYKAGTGAVGTDPEDYDLARENDKYREVYQRFGASSTFTPPAPVLDTEGNLEPGSTADYQTTVRRTLPWIPLREGYDYSTWPATDNNPSGHEADFMPPAVWLEYGGISDWYVPVENKGIGVSALWNEWGVQLYASPNHALAKNHWSGANASETDPSSVYNFDYDTLRVTLAIETDQRLKLEVDLPSGDETVLDIEVPDAEFWLLEANTMVGTTDGGHPLYSDGASDRVLRNDSSRLYLVMAGAIARYFSARVRADIVIKGLQPWEGLLGQILTVVEEDGDTEPVQAAITSIRWVGGREPQTIISAGHAR